MSTPPPPSVALPIDDPRTIIADTPMRARQMIVVAICFLLNALDGFDVLAITFAAPGIAKDWQIEPGAIGFIISIGLAGMVVGSLTLGPLADRIGRRRQILFSLIVMTAGMFASAFAPDIITLSILRAITGLGLGAMLASINAMAAEYANKRRRDLSVSIMAAGYPVGGVIGGWVAAQLLRTHGWESVFIFGGIATAMMIPLVLALMPESIGWLATSGRADALSRINRILRRMGHREGGQLARVETQSISSTALFGPEYRVTTIALIVMYGAHMMTFYYALGWAPSLVAALGFNPSSASIISVFMNLGGATGGFVLGFLAPRVGLKPMLLIGMTGAAVAVTAFGMVPANFLALQVGAVILGFLSNGSVVGFYALMARAYPTALRAGGTGVVIGFGRIGAALGPLIAGQLLAWNMGRTVTSAALALGSLVAAIILATVAIRGVREGESVD
ncbi:MAG: MFS transporter [Sphingobium sp. 32-64-5]|nr:MAG: MFS transporter [Sphingobium sp. 32-64-5]